MKDGSNAGINGNEGRETRCGVEDAIEVCVESEFVKDGTEP